MSGSKHPELRHKAWSAVRILNVRLRFILLMVITGLIAAKWDGITAHLHRWAHPNHATEAAAGVVPGAIEYYCPMHPSIVRSEPGNCPICGMPLVKRAHGETATLPEGTLARVQLSPYRIQLAGVATTEVGYRAVDDAIRTVGTIDVDERRVAHIASRVAGRIDALHVDFTGEPVAKGQALAEIYSPDLVSTRQEYAIAVNTWERLRSGGAPDDAVADAKGVVDAARERMRLWGIDDAQIDAQADGAGGVPHMTIHSPIGGIVTDKEISAGQYVMEGTPLYTVTDLSTVWVNANVYEGDLGRVKVGDPISVTSDATGDLAIEGKVAFIQPVLDAATRTLKIRADVPNPGFALRPGMYVNVRIRTAGSPSGAPGAGRAAGAVTAAAVRAVYTCPMDPEVVSDKPGNCPICGMILQKVEAAAADGSQLAIPATAVIDTGTRRVVYLEREEGTFDAVEVKVGPESDGYVAVLSGLTPGDKVVSQGAFLIDAESRLNPAAAGSYFGATGGPKDGAGNGQSGEGQGSGSMPGMPGMK